MQDDLSERGIALPSKDMKRFLSNSEKAECLAAAGYKCEGIDCTDRDLTSKTYHFHHVKPHSQFGLTTRYNTQVLCASCHQKIHSKHRKEVFTSTGWDGLRQWQRDALDRFIETFNDPAFVLEAAPGAGKSRFAAFATQYAISEAGLDHVVFIAPWTPILDSVRKNFGPLKLDYRDKFHYDKKRGKLQAAPSIDVTLDTYAGFCNPVTIDVIKHWQEVKGWTFMLVLDEIHHTNTTGGKWGPYIERIASMSSKLVVMSGTYFRSDNKPISFLEYENDKPKTNFSISFSECVRHRFTRQVSFRFHDPRIELLKKESGKIIDRRLSKLMPGHQKQFETAKATVLDSNGEHVHSMIVDAWTELQAMRRKWADAACLVVCKVGVNDNEERVIHAIESKIKQITSHSPEVVTSDDSTSRGKLENFCKSSEPFLCAIRMVSEGVDIPRIRMVLFLSYTDSEMLFRQIVGRCCRYQDGKEDDTAALVILPKFKLMAEFAERFEHESKLGALKIEPMPGSADQASNPKQLGPCKKCGHSPCMCYIVLDSEVAHAGGMIAASSVEEEYIKRAKVIRDTSAAHQHANAVQLGDALQRSAMMGELFVSTVEESRALACKKVETKIRKIARYKYGGDYTACWIKEVHEVFGADMSEIRNTWRSEQIMELDKTLRSRLAEVVLDA
jgi:superfamily II DNA or RNA helicase